MKELTSSELKDIQMGIMDYIHSVCMQNGIKYSLSYGSLLGAVRHKGFIPWDDDIDISMLREDYDKFIEIHRSNNNGRYKLSCVELDPECMYSIGKVIDTETVLYELGEDGIRTGIYVDIFIFDGVPEDESEFNKIFDKIDFYGRLRKYQLPLKPHKLTIKRAIINCIRVALKILPRQYFTRKLVENARKNKCDNSKIISDISDPYYISRWKIEKAVFEDLIEMDFEDRKYTIPKRYDEWLKMQYGDYMKLPPEEDRKSHHEIKAYLL